jgi:hypothetical protein
MHRVAFIVVPAVVLGIAGFCIGRDTNGIVAVIAGALGGGLGGWAALGVWERARAT